MTIVRKMYKALAAGAGAGVGAFITANQVGGVSGEEWGGIIGAVLFAAFVTYWAPKNATPDA